MGSAYSSISQKRRLRLEFTVRKLELIIDVKGIMIGEPLEVAILNAIVLCRSALHYQDMADFIIFRDQDLP